MNTISTIEPQTRLISAITRLATEAHAFVGRACLDGKIIDGNTGERLFAAIDRRAGNKKLKGSQSKWGDVKEAVDYWAQRVGRRVREEREFAQNDHGRLKAGG